MFKIIAHVGEWQTLYVSGHADQRLARAGPTAGSAEYSDSRFWVQEIALVLGKDDGRSRAALLVVEKTRRSVPIIPVLLARAAAGPFVESLQTLLKARRLGDASDAVELVRQWGRDADQFIEWYPRQKSGRWVLHHSPGIAALLLLVLIIVGPLRVGFRGATGDTGPVGRPGGQGVQGVQGETGGPGDSVPIGAILLLCGEAKLIPRDYLRCDGREIREEEYPKLHAQRLQIRSGASGKVTVPDLRNPQRKCFYIMKARSGRGDPVDRAPP